MNKPEIKGRFLWWKGRVWYAVWLHDYQRIADDTPRKIVGKNLIHYNGVVYCPFDKVKIDDDLSCSRQDLGPVWVMEEIKLKNGKQPIIKGPYELFGVSAVKSVIRKSGREFYGIYNEYCRLATWVEVPE